MSWQLFLILSILAESFGRILQRFLLKDNKSDPVAYVILYQLLIGLIIGVYAFLNGFKIPNLMPILPNIIAMPVFYGLSNLLIFKSLKTTEASLFTILFASRVIFIVLGAIFFLHESFTIKQFLGGFLIILSVFIISWKGQKINFQKGQVFALFAAIFLGFGITNDAFIVRSFDIPSYLTFAFIIPGSLIWIASPATTLKIVTLVKNGTVVKIACLAFIYGLGTVAYFSAYHVGNNAAQIASLFQTSSILSVLLAIIFLNERSGISIKIFAAILSFIGILLAR